MKIILIILLIILLAVLGIILIALLMPVRIGFGFVDGKLSYSLKYGLLNIIDSNGKGVVAWLTNRSKKPKKKKKDKSPKEDLPAPEEEASLPTEESAPICDATVCDETETPEESPVTETEADAAAPAEETSESPAAEESTEQSTPAAEETAAAETDAPKGKTLGEKADFILRVWGSAKKPVRRIFKGFHFKDIMIDLVIAHEDAYKCALRYGKVNGAVFNTLAFMRLIFTSKEKTVDIRAGFGTDKSRYDVSLKLWFMPMTAVVSGVWFLLTYIFRIYLPDKKAAKQKNAARQSEV